MSKSQRSLLAFGFKRHRETAVSKCPGEIADGTICNSVDLANGNKRRNSASAPIKELERLQHSLVKRMNESNEQHFKHRFIHDKEKIINIDNLVGVIFPALSHVNFAATEDSPVGQSEPFFKTRSPLVIDDNSDHNWPVCYNFSQVVVSHLTETGYVGPTINQTVISAMRDYLMEHCSLSNDYRLYDRSSDYSDSSCESSDTNLFYHPVDNSIDPVAKLDRMPKCLLLQSRDANILSSIVFAAANECGYNLIELGPDTKRSGADLISELAESTKSHSIHHGQAKKISLIFLSQVDVLYEQDQGFWNALLSIVLNSRRLIIMSCSALPRKVCEILDIGRIIRLLPCDDQSFEEDEDTNMSPHLYQLGVMENSLFDHDHDNIDDFSSYLQRICSSESFIAWAVKFGYWESQPFYTLSPSDERPNDCISYKLTLADVESQMLTDNSTFIDSIFQSAFSSHAIQASGKAEIGGFHRAPLMTKWEKVLTRYIPEALVYQNRKAFWEFVLPYIVRIFKARIEQQKIDTGTLTGNEFSRTRRSNRLRDRRTESYLPSWDFDGECMLAKSYLAGY